MIEGLRSIVALGRDSLRGIAPADVSSSNPPQFEWIAPRELFVEEAYQRDLSENSIGLIRRIVAGWSWARFKTPICVRIDEWDGVLVCIDGQHTAIAAASHPGIDKIPVMIVDARDVADRAAAFVGHNRDRIGLTQMAVFYAELASGDPLAIIVDAACKAAGAKILNKSINLRQKLPAGQTIAVGTIRNIARRQGGEFLARVLGVLTRAGRGPIKADEIVAAAVILNRAPPGEALDTRLEEVVRSKSAQQWAALAAVASAQHGSRKNAASDALSGLWARELGIRLRPATRPLAQGKAPTNRPISPGTPGGAPGDPARGTTPPTPNAARIAQIKEASQKPAAPRPAPRPVSPLPAIAPKPAIAPAPARPVPAGEVFSHGGIWVDTGQGIVRRDGRTAEVSQISARLIALLARVRPGFLEAADLIQKLHLDAFRLRSAAQAANPALSPLGLEIKNVMKTGWMIAEIGG